MSGTRTNLLAPARLIVVTGGPGAGKTAVLETVRRHFSSTVRVVPEAAGMLFEGGFPSRADSVGRAAAQRAIFRVQRELEDLALADDHAPTILCDRGSLDALAYWPYDQASFYAQLGTSAELERARYATVIHLRTPSFAQGYNLGNTMRIETPEQAAELDRSIERAWAGHPHRHFIDCQEDFLLKLTLCVRLLREEIAGRCVLESTQPAH
jgi:predicted ATPase